MQHIVILLQKLIVQKQNLVQHVELILLVLGIVENVCNLQDAQHMQKQLTQIVKQYQIDA
jgi:hypothetical protein